MTAVNFVTHGRTARRKLTLPPLSGGVDFSSPPHRIADNRLSDATNLWWHDGMLRTRPAVCVAGSIAAPAAHGVATTVGRYTVLHAVRDGVNLLAIADENGTITGNTLVINNVRHLLAVPAGKSVADFDCRALVYLDTSGTPGTYLLTPQGDLRVQKPFVPTVLYGALPTPTRVRRESGAIRPFNMLTEEYKCTYTSDGEGKYYWLPLNALPADGTPFWLTITAPNGTATVHLCDAITSNGTWVESAPGADGYTLWCDPVRGCVWLEKDMQPVALPASEMAGNITARGIRAATGGRDIIYGMRFGTWFGGSADGLSGGTRLFLSGNAESPQLVHWSALDNPLYFPENNCARVGDAASRITAFGKQSDMLVIFKEHEIYATQYRTGQTITAEEQLAGQVTDPEAEAAVFPIQQVHPEIGCTCPNTIRLCGDRLVWLHGDGRVYALFSGGTYDPRSVRALSVPIEAELQQYTPAARTAASAARLKGQYLLYIGGTVYALDTTAAGFENYTAYATDERAQAALAWQVWTAPTEGVWGLTQAGATPLFVMRLGEQVFTCRYTDEAADRVPTQNGNTVTITAQPIACSLTTKWYETAYPDEYKQLCEVRLRVAGDADERVTVSLQGDSYTRRELASFTLSGAVPQHTYTRRVAANVPRTRQCGITVSCTGRMALDGLELTYRNRGEARQ